MPMYGVLKRIVLNQLAGIPWLRRFKDARGPKLEKYADPDYVAQVCRHHIEAVRQYGSLAPGGQEIVEIGPGGNLGSALLLIASGARRVTCVDNYRHVDFQPRMHQFHQQLVEDILAGRHELLAGSDARWDLARARAALDEAVTFSAGRVQFNPDRIRYLAPCDARALPLEDASVDLLFSHAVLEHVKQPADVCREMGRVLKPGGYTSHVIDLRDHFDPAGLEMLRHPDWLWHLMASHSHGFVNRCRAVHFQQFFATAGIELKQFQPTETLADPRRIPAVVSRPFAGLSAEQLQVVGLSVVGVRREW